MNRRQLIPVIALLAIALVVFGVFVVLNLTTPPASPTDEVSQTAQPADGEATEDSSAQTPLPTGTEAAAEATDQVGEQTEAPASPEQSPTVAGTPSPTSLSREQDSILLGTQVTPALESTPVPQDAAASGAQSGSVTPTSLSREQDSILIGTQVTPALESTAVPANAAASGDDGVTPTSLSRVTQSILLGSQATPALETTPVSQGAAASGDDGVTPTSLSRVTQSIEIGETATPSPETSENTPEATAEATAETTAAAAPESTDQAGAAAVGNGTPSTPPAMPTPVPGRFVDAASALEPRGFVADRQAALWWLMLGVGTVIYLIVLAMVLYTVLRRHREREAALTQRQTALFIVGGGVVLPAVIITLIFALTIGTMAVLAFDDRPTEVTVEVTGHQWWWEVRYPEQGFVTANEIHIPVGQPIRFDLTSADVIHSFWVPQLGGKMDLFPGRTNTFWLQADAPGDYRGVCAEFCGIQHAKMAFWVIAHEQDEFDAWAANQQKPAREPETELAQRGREIFLNSECIACHAVRGTNAQGIQGPDLTHFGSRRSIGAGTVPNTAGYLGGWIVDSHGIKPGNLMPPQDIPAEDLQPLITYLGSLQ